MCQKLAHRPKQKNDRLDRNGVEMLFHRIRLNTNKKTSRSWHPIVIFWLTKVDSRTRTIVSRISIIGSKDMLLRQPMDLSIFDNNHEFSPESIRGSHDQHDQLQQAKAKVWSWKCHYCIWCYIYLLLLLLVYLYNNHKLIVVVDVFVWIAVAFDQQLQSKMAVCHFVHIQQTVDIRLWIKSITPRSFILIPQNTNVKTLFCGLRASSTTGTPTQLLVVVVATTS